ncbi:hypothetical protein HWV62_36103 [Athelia sp. TMB]|nr:hypothetical protein HWV62_36103 [Athelia sp. TMB]
MKMVFVNKAVMNNAPNLTILFMQIQAMVSVILLHISALLTPRIQLPSLDLASAKKLTPFIAIGAGGFVFNALTLRDVPAAFYQVARGMVLPLTIVVVAFTTRKAPAWTIVGCAAVVSFGFLVGVTPSSDNTPSSAVPGPLALLYGLMSSLAVAIHAVLIKSSLPVVDGSSIKLCYWGNLGSAIILGVFAVLKGEVTIFIDLIRSGTWDWTTFAWGNLVTGVFGFLIGIAGILSVKITSPVTHMFSSAARSVLQVALGIQIFGDILTVQSGMSVLIILVGTILYTWVKSQETPAPAPPENIYLRDPRKNRSTNNLNEDGADGNKSVSDTSEIFSHDSGDEEANIPSSPSRPERYRF